MKKEEYVETIVLGDRMINIGLNDDGLSCGAYNFNYIDTIKDCFDFDELEKQQMQYLLDKKFACGLDIGEQTMLDDLLWKHVYNEKLRRKIYCEENVEEQ